MAWSESPEYQDWLILNLDRCCSHERVRGYDHFLDFIFRDHKWLVLLLARPVFRSQAPKVCLPPHGTPRSDLGSLALPPEIIDLVFTYIYELRDIVSLAVSHRLLSVAGWRRMVHVRRSHPAANSWSGNRIIAIGDMVEELDDLPEGVGLTSMKEVMHLPEHGARQYPSEDEIQKMRQEYQEVADGDSDVELEEFDLNEELGIYEFEDHEDEGVFCYAREHYPQLGETSAEKRGGSVHHTGRSTPRSKLDDQRANMFYASTAPYYPAASEWALCNSTRKEYVLASTMAEIPRWQTKSVAYGPFIVSQKDAYYETLFDLGAVALHLTTWSKEMGPIGEPGPWAGDRLSIMREEDLTQEGDIAEWTDVSTEMQERVRKWMWRNHEHLEQDMAIYVGPEHSDGKVYIDREEYDYRESSDESDYY